MNNILKKYYSFFVFEGILLVILGSLAIIIPQLATFGANYLLGLVLFTGGVYKLFSSIKMKNELEHFGTALLSGIIATGVGIYLILYPLKGILLLTLALGLYFAVDGLSAMVFATKMRKSNRNWHFLLLSGIVSVILSALVLGGFPYTASWALGVILGVNLITYGIAVMMIASTAYETIKT